MRARKLESVTLLRSSRRETLRWAVYQIHQINQCLSFCFSGKANRPEPPKTPLNTTNSFFSPQPDPHRFFCFSGSLSLFGARVILFPGKTGNDPQTYTILSQDFDRVGQICRFHTWYNSRTIDVDLHVDFCVELSKSLPHAWR